MQVRIGAIDYPVHWEREDSEDFGETLGTFSPTSGIELSPDQSPSSAASTLIHEIIHAIWAVYRLPERIKDQEDACLHLEGPLAAFLRDNIGVVSAIQVAMNDGIPFRLTAAPKD